MSKKNTSKPEAPKKEEFPAIDDFFTQFIEKRKKYWTQKLDDIAQLEKMADLKPDQVEKINNKGATLEKVKYFDDIKAMYFEAAAKKGKGAQAEAAGQDSKDTKLDEFVDALAAGKLLSIGKISVLEGEKETAADLAEAYAIISGAALVNDRGLAKKRLGSALEQKNFGKIVKGVFEFHASQPAETHVLVKMTPHAHPHAHGHAHQHTQGNDHTHDHAHDHAKAHGHEHQAHGHAHHEHPKEAPKDDYKKPNLFYHSSDDEHVDHHEHKHGPGRKHSHKEQHGHDQKKKDGRKESSDNQWLVPLPEAEKPTEEEFVRLDKHRSHRGAPRKPYGGPGGRFQGERRPREGEQAEGKGLEDGGKGHDQEGKPEARFEGRREGGRHEGGRQEGRSDRGDAEKRGGYKGKNYDPNFRRNHSGRQQGESYVERKEVGQDLSKGQAQGGEGQKKEQQPKPTATEIKQ